jgi:hypothetical protein
MFGQTSVMGGPCYGLAHGLSAQRQMGRLTGEEPFPRLNLPPIAAQKFQ